MKTRMELITPAAKEFFHNYNDGLISATELILGVLALDIHVSVIKPTAIGTVFEVMSHSDSENPDIFPIDRFTVTVTH